MEQATEWQQKELRLKLRGAALLRNESSAFKPGSSQHYFPLLYAVGANGNPARAIHEGFQSGTLSMRSVQFG